MLNIPILLGTARKERQSENVANFVHFQAQEYGFKSKLIDVKDFSLTKTIAPWQENLKGQEWRKIVKKADGLVIIVPEYNHSYPGELKLMMDQIFDEYARKPVALCGVSSGNFGGVRVVDMILPYLITLKMVPVPATVYFSNVEELFNKIGKIKEDFYNKRVVSLFKELEWYAQRLKA